MRFKRKSRIVIIAAAVSLFLLLEVDLSASTSNIVRVNGRQVESLDGRWEIIFDPENEGREGDWHKQEVFSAHAGRRDITVPCCWELIEKDYEGVAFYRRTFKVPISWEDKVVHVQFDAVNFQSEVWINDKAAGFHEGGFTPFKFRIDKLLKAGAENTITRGPLWIYLPE